MDETSINLEEDGIVSNTNNEHIKHKWFARLYLAGKWSQILLFPFVTVMFWIGMWTTVDLYILNRYSFVNGVIWRDLAYVVLGLTLLGSIRLFWPKAVVDNRIPNFQWKAKIKNFAKLIGSMMSGVIFWCGFWNFLDTFFPSTLLRNGLYVLISVPLLFVLHVIMKPSSLRRFVKDDTLLKQSIDEDDYISDPEDFLTV